MKFAYFLAPFGDHFGAQGPFGSLKNSRQQQDPNNLFSVADFGVILGGILESFLASFWVIFWTSFLEAFLYGFSLNLEPFGSQVGP